MKQGIAILIFFLIYTFTAFSQKDYRKGYFVNNTGDTTFGSIEYRGDRANSKYCLFTKSAGTEVLKLTPQQISAYRFADSKYYVSKVIITPLGYDTVFLEYLVNGIVDFYYFRDNFGEHYLVDNGDGRLSELKNEQAEVIVDNRTYAREAKEYVGVLKYTFVKSPSVCKEVENISLGHKSLIRLATEYHSEVCNDSLCVTYEKNLPKIKIVFGPLAGINAISVTEIYHDFSDCYYLENSNFSSDVYPSLGFFAKINMPYASERLFFQYEGTFSAYNIKTTNSNYYAPAGLNLFNQISLTQVAYNSSFMFRYEFPLGKFRPAFGAGYFLNYYLKSDYLRKLDFTLYGEKYYAEFQDYPFQKAESGLNLGLGIITNIKKKSLFLDLKYQYGFGLMGYFRSNTFSLNVGIQVGN